MAEPNKGMGKEKGSIKGGGPAKRGMGGKGWIKQGRGCKLKKGKNGDVQKEEWVIRGKGLVKGLIQKRERTMSRKDRGDFKRD